MRWHFTAEASICRLSAKILCHSIQVILLLFKWLFLCYIFPSDISLDPVLTQKSQPHVSPFRSQNTRATRCERASLGDVCTESAERRLNPTHLGLDPHSFYANCATERKRSDTMFQREANDENLGWQRLCSGVRHAN